MTTDAHDYIPPPPTRLPPNGNRTYKVSEATAQRILAELARRMQAKTATPDPPEKIP